MALDDVTRPAYIEELSDVTRRSTMAFLVRALRWFRVCDTRSEQAMTDNYGSSYAVRLLGKAFRLLAIRHIHKRPYTPKRPGKAECFIQTPLREWAYAIQFSVSDTRAAVLPRRLTWYIQQSPHASFQQRTPALSIAGII